MVDCAEGHKMSLSRTHVVVVVSACAVLAVANFAWWLVKEADAASAEEAVLAACAKLDEADHYVYTSVEVRESGSRATWDRFERQETHSGDEYHATLKKFFRDKLEESLEWLGVDGQHWYRSDGGEWEEREEISWLLVPKCYEYVGYKDLGTSLSPSGVEARHYAVAPEDGNYFFFGEFSMTRTLNPKEIWVDDEGRLIQMWSRYDHFDSSLPEDEWLITSGIRTFSGWGEPRRIPKLSELQE